MICLAIEQDGEQICAITARTGVFSAEEVQYVVEIWQEYLGLGSETSGIPSMWKKTMGVYLATSAWARAH